MLAFLQLRWRLPHIESCQGDRRWRNHITWLSHCRVSKLLGRSKIVIGLAKLTARVTNWFRLQGRCDETSVHRCLEMYTEQVIGSVKGTSRATPGSYKYKINHSIWKKNNHATTKYRLFMIITLIVLRIVRPITKKHSIDWQKCSFQFTSWRNDRMSHLLNDVENTKMFELHLC